MRELKLQLPRFARGFTHPFGKMASPLGQLRLPEETDALIREAAARARKSPIEYARELLVLRLHGREEIVRRSTINLDSIEQVLPKRNETVSADGGPE